MNLKRDAVIFGLGHIGASLAKALTQKGHSVWGWDKSGVAVRFCLKKKWIAGVADEKSLSQLRNPLCILAIPEAAIVHAEVGARLAMLPFGSSVTDVFSSKGYGVEELRRRCELLALDYAWSHPLAGREGHGPSSADAEIFAGAPVLLDRLALPRLRKELSSFWKSLGCKPEFLSTAEHQRAMAGGSHLVHALAFALVTQVSSQKNVRISPSVRGATRVAKSSPEAWQKIFVSNASEVAGAISRLSRELTKVEGLIRKKNEKVLLAYLARAHRVRLKWEVLR